MLSGVTVLEVGQVIAGTYAGVILADLGAEVIKIEPPHGDANRNPGIAPLRGESAIALFMNRNKKSVCLDLKVPAGLETFYRLVETADVVIDNFRPGVMERLGVGHAELAKRNPDVVTVSVTGFGESGPYRDRPAFDLVIQALAGHLHITGDPAGPPARVGIPLADIAGGIFACISALAGLSGRLLHATGGTHVDVSMLDSLVSLLSYDALDFLNTGREVSRQGTAHAHMVPWEAFQVRDGYVVVAVREEKFWRRLCDALGRPELMTDPRTESNGARVANREFVTGLLREAFAAKTTAEWVKLFEYHGLPGAPVNDLERVFEDPQVQARGIVRSYEHPTAGTVRYPASPMQVTDWQFPNSRAPLLAEHTAAVLAERLGLDEAELRSLSAQGAIRLSAPRGGAGHA